MTWRRITLLTAVTIALSACSTIPRSCRGLVSPVLPTSGNEQANITQLQCAADQNDVSAQVQLAKRYEVGDGVPRDPGHAAALYERAATAVPRTTAIYSPPVRVGGRGQMIFLANPNAGPGSAEAQYRLGILLLKGQGVAHDPKRGHVLIERAAKQGYPPAIAELTKPGS